MPTPPFSIGLRLTLEVSRRQVIDRPAPDFKQGWRERFLTYVDQREMDSRGLPGNVMPTELDAERILGETFGGLGNGGPELLQGSGVGAERVPEAFVIAEIVALPDLAPIPPGGEFPDVSDAVVDYARLVHRAPWTQEPGSVAELDAARQLLDRIAASTSRDLWF